MPISNPGRSRPDETDTRKQSAPHLLSDEQHHAIRDRQCHEVRHKETPAFGPDFFHSVLPAGERIEAEGKQSRCEDFADLYFPRLSRANPDRPKRIFFDLTIVGPDGAAPMPLARKAILEGKNWRLNGELVNNPLEMPNRFDILAPDDIAIMAADGEDEPAAVNLVLFAAASAKDKPDFDALAPITGAESMVTTDAVQLAALLVGLAADHPARTLLPDSEFDQALEDAAVGGISGTEKLLELVRTRPVTPRITAAALEKARRRAEQIGQAGEELIADLLEAEVAAGKIASFAWSSRANAATPYDFTSIDSAGTVVRIDAKTTTGPFGRKFHISGAEMLEAASGAGVYQIYRLYELTDDGEAKLRRSSDVTDATRTIRVPLGAPTMSEKDK